MGIIIAITVFFTFTYLLVTELVTAKIPKGEVLIFPRGSRLSGKQHGDIEKPLQSSRLESIDQISRKVTATIQKQTSIFQWKDICFDIKIQKEHRRILDHVDGWVIPGTLTALMVSDSQNMGKAINLSARKNLTESDRAHLELEKRLFWMF